jgi:hypothetical protein
MLSANASFSSDSGGSSVALLVLASAALPFDVPSVVDNVAFTAFFVTDDGLDVIGNLRSK